MSQHCPPKRAYVSLHVLSDRPSSARGPACSARGQASSARGPASASGARGSTCAALHEARAAKNARPGIQRALLGICILRARPGIGIQRALTCIQRALPSINARRMQVGNAWPSPGTMFLLFLLQQNKNKNVSFDHNELRQANVWSLVNWCPSAFSNGYQGGSIKHSLMVPTDWHRGGRSDRIHGQSDGTHLFRSTRRR